MLKPGDASMASPFTAKAAGIMPCTDIVRQGRATLVTTLQMFKILGLLCLQTAYSLSVQYLQAFLPSPIMAHSGGHPATLCFQKKQNAAVSAMCSWQTAIPHTLCVPLAKVLLVPACWAIIPARWLS